MSEADTQSTEKNHHNTNVDHQEVAKFEALAQRWWDETVNLSLYMILTHCVLILLMNVRQLLKRKYSMSVVAEVFCLNHLLIVALM